MMTMVKRYKVWSMKDVDESIPDDVCEMTEVVLASDYDALAGELAAANSLLARGMVSSDKMMYWHERSMAVEDARLKELGYVAKVLEACRRASPSDVRDELNDLRAWLNNRIGATDHLTKQSDSPSDAEAKP